MDFRPEFSWEFLSSDQIGAKTLRALRNHIKYVKEVSPFYREALNEIEPGDITSFENFQRIPFTNKGHLTQHYQEFQSAPPEKVNETVVTSGSTGHAVPITLTAADLDRISYNEALSFHSIGIKPGERAQILIGLEHLPIAGIAFYRGLTLLGANTMRVGILDQEKLRYLLDIFKPVLLVGAPSYLKKIAQEFSKNNINVQSFGVKKLVCTGESLKTADMQSNFLGSALETLWGAKVFSSYTSTELLVSYCECEHQTGGHAHPELVYTEIINDKGITVPDGTPGELVATSLGVEGMPLVRFRTGDITFKTSEPCTCGRNSIRIGPILGRKSQMIKVKDATIFPLTLTNTLDAIELVKDYVIILENDNALSDRVSIHVAAPPSTVEQIANQIRAVTRINFPILISNVNTIQSFRGDSPKVRVVDWRKNLVKK